MPGRRALKGQEEAGKPVGRLPLESGPETVVFRVEGAEGRSGSIFFHWAEVEGALGG